MPAAASQADQLIDEGLADFPGGEEADWSNEQIIKGPWATAEDEQLMVLVRQYGPKRWSMIASQMPGRIGKQVASLPL